MSFKHFYKTCFTEIEVEAQLEVLNESRWWGNFKESPTILEYETEDKKKRKLKAWKMDEDGSSPAYVIEARRGLRYGLYRTTEGKFICARLKPGKKNIIKPKGVFREVEGKLIFELTFKGGKQIGGSPELIRKAIANNKKKFNPEQTLLPPGQPSLKIRPGDGMPKDDVPFDPSKTLEEAGESNDEIIKGISEYLIQQCHLTKKQLRNWWTITDIEDIGLMWSEKAKPWIDSQKSTSPEVAAPIAERRANVEPNKSFPNGEPTFDKNTDEWNKGVYTDAKA